MPVIPNIPPLYLQTCPGYTGPVPRVDGALAIAAHEDRAAKDECNRRIEFIARTLAAMSPR